jgi:hypothetical protein
LCKGQDSNLHTLLFRFKINPKYIAFTNSATSAIKGESFYTLSIISYMFLN